MQHLRVLYCLNPRYFCAHVSLIFVVSAYRQALGIKPDLCALRIKFLVPCSFRRLSSTTIDGSDDVSATNASKSEADISLSLFSSYLFYQKYCCPWSHMLSTSVLPTSWAFLFICFLSFFSVIFFLRKLLKKITVDVLY
jgi:hypothetical protein